MIPYRFDRTATAGELHERHAELPDGAETEDTVSVAGRMLLRRVQGKVAFATMADPTGRIQLFAGVQTTPRFDDFCSLSLGDWLGVTGTVMRTRRGELSVRVDDWCVLAEARRQFPDKWHGLVDVDTRYRQRYVDLWVSEEADALRQRSRILSLIRRWLEERGYVEVETPTFHPIPGGAAAKPFVTHHNALDMDLFLRIAPELFLKRLVVGGFEKVFELARVFRNEGLEGRFELVQRDRSAWDGASGAQYFKRDFEAVGAEVFLPPNKTASLGLFTLQEFKFGELGVEASARIDRTTVQSAPTNFDRDFSAPSVAFGLSYQLTPTAKAGLNLSRTTRAPSAEELLSNGPHIATQAFEIGAPNLKLEKSVGAEAYIRFDRRDFSFNLTGFANWFDDFIYEDATGEEEDELPVFRYFQRDATYAGFEAQASLTLGRLGGFFFNDTATTEIYTTSTITHARQAGRVPTGRRCGVGLCPGADPGRRPGAADPAVPNPRRAGGPVGQMGRAARGRACREPGPRCPARNH